MKLFRRGITWAVTYATDERWQRAANVVAFAFLMVVIIGIALTDDAIWAVLAIPGVLLVLLDLAVGAFVGIYCLWHCPPGNR